MNLTTIQSTADSIDSAIDAIAPIVGIFVPYASDAKLAADALDKVIDVALGAAKAYNDANPGGGADAAIASLQASKTQLQTAVSDAQALAQSAGVKYPGDGSTT